MNVFKWADQGSHWRRLSVRPWFFCRVHLVALWEALCTVEWDRVPALAFTAGGLWLGPTDGSVTAGRLGVLYQRGTVLGIQSGNSGDSGIASKSGGQCNQLGRVFFFPQLFERQRERVSEHSHPWAHTPDAHNGWELGWA